MSAARTLPIEALLEPFDALRGRLLRAFAPRARRLFVDRDRRVAFFGSAALVLAFSATCVRPLWGLALGPLVWGIPHLVADVRYLVVRPSLHRHAAAIAAAAIAAFGLVLGFGVRAGLAAAAVAALGSRAPFARRAVIACAFAGLVALAQTAPWKADVVFVQAHNFVALALWFAWPRRAPGLLRAIPLAVVALGSLLIVASPVDRFLAAGGLDAPFAGVTLQSFAGSLSFSDDPTITLRLVLLFAFTQSAHYVVWLRLLPEDDRRGTTPRSFTQSFRALERDVGKVVLAVATVAAVMVLVSSLVSVASARDVYLGIAYFHAYLEVIAIAIFAAEGRLDRPRE